MRIPEDTLGDLMAGELSAMSTFDQLTHQNVLDAIAAYDRGDRLRGFGEATGYDLHAHHLRELSEIGRQYEIDPASEKINLTRAN